MAEKLTPQQKQAVENRGGKLLVSAAAGSGKTKVLVDRLMRYLRDPVDPANLDEFLIITYTKAAASELRGKIVAKLTEAISAEPENRHLQRQMQRVFLTKISTVHGFCGDILREYAYKLDLSGDFRVADENECREIRENVLSELLDRAYESADENPEFRAFVDTQGLGRTDALVSEIVLKVYDSARCHLDPEKWLDDCLSAVDTEALTDAGETVWGRYLMEDLFSYLDSQIHALQQCALLAEQADNMEKPGINLRDTIYQLQRLRNCETWDEIAANRQIDFGRLTFPRKGVDEELAEKIKACRNHCKKGIEKYLRCFSDGSGQVLRDLAQSAAGAKGLANLVRQFGREYARAKASRRVLDFGDLEHKALDLLLGVRRSGPTAAANEIALRFREVMVDEYQDSNSVQDAIFSALTEKKQNCFMVGDVKQSIYQFRLADPGIFLDKYRRYLPAHEAEPGCGRKVLLSANFRSGGEIVEAVNDVFQACMSDTVGGLAYGEEEALREGIPHFPLPDPAVELYGIEVREDTYGEESAFVAQRIEQMLRSGTQIRDGEKLRPVRPEDIVILLRSPGSVGFRFQQALESRGIRCASGGGTDLLKTREIGTLRCILQVIANPRQDIPLIGALASPVFGFSADDLAYFRGKQKKGSVYDALVLDLRQKSQEFLKILSLLRREARMSTIAQLIEKIFVLTGMDSIYGAMDGGAARRENLQTFYQLAADYEATSRRELSQFLEYLDSQEEKGLITTGDSGGGCVTIMSIHKSKGLEFPVVFLSGLSREFNREGLRAQVLCDQKLGLGLSVADTENRVRYPAISKRAIMSKTAAESLSEEMRVLYVAMTRARDRLVMTYAAKTLQADLQDIALRSDISGRELMTRDVVCPGEWILYSAMSRREAGAFHSLGGRPAETTMGSYPWKIQVVEAPEVGTATQNIQPEQERISDGVRQRLEKGLVFRYAHEAATRVPSKQTATQRKGRIKDQEAAEQTEEPKTAHRSWRKPAFATDKTQGKAYGNAIHGAMQYLRYDCCGSRSEIRAEIQRLVEQGFLTEEQGTLVNVEKIYRFFQWEIGKKLRQGTPYLREFKFSILDDGSHYAEGLEEEQVLLQGVVDCALLEEQGITVVDFKTDYVTEETLPELLERYRDQVETYAHALSRIYQKPVTARYLYLFHLDRFEKI